jgi:hypothetical protein
MAGQELSFHVGAHQGRVTIKRQVAEGHPVFTLDFTPAEADKATKLIAMALSMIELDNVPDHINNTPFVIRFYPKQVFALERTDISGSMPFRTNEGDELISSIHMGVEILLNAQKFNTSVPQHDFLQKGVADSEPM